MTRPTCSQFAAPQVFVPEPRLAGFSLLWQVTCKPRELTFLVRKVIGEAAGNCEGIVRNCRISSGTGKYRDEQKVGAEGSSWDGWLEIGKRRADPSDKGAAWAAIAGGAKRAVGWGGGAVGLRASERGQVVEVGRMGDEGVGRWGGSRVTRSEKLQRQY